MDPIVSIIIVNFNGLSFLPACLSSLENVSSPVYQLIIVDNASTDGSVPYLQTLKNCEVHYNKNNSGFAGGNNIGLRLAKGRFVLLLNSDTIVNPGFLQPLVDYLLANPGVGIVQGKMALPNYDGTLDVCGGFLTQMGFLYHYGYFKRDQPLYQRSYPVFTAKGACLMFRRELIERVGGFLFNEGFFCYYEETEFCHRSWIAGFETHFVCSPTIQHCMGSTSTKHQPNGFVLRQFLANQTFSLLANLSWSSRFSILPFYFALFFTSLGASILTGKTVVAGAHLFALKRIWVRRGEIKAQRKMIARIRKNSDAEIFRLVKRTPKLSYFLLTFRGKLAEYKDAILE
ncbi:MAG: glycosyl transferase, family 2 [Verrucomicrobiales bacterium]|nr:glycosyl transferase, family 2 [Verrucomicrobiales bacterium]